MIDFEKLSFRYGKRNLFNELNLQLKTGNIYGLLGLNGAGKTTLLKILSGQLFRTGGTAEVLGYDPGRRHPGMLGDIFYLPEEFYLPAEKAEVYLRLNQVYYPRFDRKAFESYLETFQLDRSQKIGDYSFGQKKKFLLAFGLASNTKLLILDEPTNGLDIPSKSQFRKTIASAITPDRSFIISTHQVRDMESLIDPVIILHEGRIVMNCTLEFAESRIMMEKTTGEPDGSGGLLYKEKVPGGWYAVKEISEGLAESALDLEILFNAVISDPGRMEKLMKGAEA